MSKLRDDLYQRLHGFKSVKRSHKKQGQSDWYYLNPRYDTDDDPRGEIDVPSENSFNPKLSSILTDEMNENPEDYYIWRTEKDDRVRGKHAEREGKIFNWHIPPEGGHPGEDYNCRCWAEPYRPERHNDKPMIVDVSGLEMFKELQKTLKPVDFDTSSLPQYAENDKVTTASDATLLQKHTKYLIGSLSQEFESNTNPAVIGFDNAGGHSYGLYQIATRPGTMKEYLEYLANHPNPTYKNFAEILNNAGGNFGAMNRTSDFENAWKKLARYSEFTSSQSEFIGKNRYNKIINRIQDIKGLNLQKRHPVIKDVIRSMAVQHGQAQIPIHNALGTNSNISSWSDEKIINSLYDARTDYMAGIHYTDSNDIKKQQNIIHKRYPKERKKALDALKIKY